VACFERGGALDDIQGAAAVVRHVVHEGALVHVRLETRAEVDCAAEQGACDMRVRWQLR